MVESACRDYDSMRNMRESAREDLNPEITLLFEKTIVRHVGSELSSPSSHAK
jgi:hypothetical protein